MNWIRKRLNEDAKRWDHLWSIRLTLFWGAFNAMLCAADLLAGTDVIAKHAVLFAFVNGVGHFTIFVARLYKQPGLST